MRISDLVPVSQVADIVLGGTPKRSKDAYWGGDIKWASAKDITSVKTRYIYNTEETITALGLEESNTKLLPKDTIVITARGTVGAMAMLSEPMTFNQTCYGLLAKEGVDSTHLFYALKADLSKIKSVSYGTVFDTITMKSFDAITIPLPPLEEQKRIAHILGTLDDKIELNQRMNATLEEIARAVFKSWFVDFDPVRAKMAGEPYSLPDEVMALFPDELVDGELGLIPKGWEVEKISDEFKVTMGQSPPGSSYNEERKGISFYQGRTDFGFRYPSKRVYCTDPKRFAEAGDTLVSVRAPVGDINMAAERCCIGRGVASVMHKSGYKSYTYYSMLDLQRRFTQFESEGTVFGSIGKKDFNSLTTVIPSNELKSKFEDLIFENDEMIECNFLNTKSLTEIRNELMQDFFL